jgi:hypothetical protein
MDKLSGRVIGPPRSTPIILRIRPPRESGGGRREPGSNRSLDPLARIGDTRDGSRLQTPDAIGRMIGGIWWTGTCLLHVATSRS